MHAVSASNGHPLCGAKTKSGGTCRNPAGAGTPHPGLGRCRFHLGNTPTHIAAAAPALARGLLPEAAAVEPHDALLELVRWTATEVRVCRAVVQSLETEALVDTPLTLTLKVTENGDGGSYEQRVEHPVELNIWLRKYHAACDRLANYAKTAIACGVAERHVTLVEQLGEQFALVCNVMFDELGASPEERRRILPLIEQRLRPLERTESG